MSDIAFRTDGEKIVIALDNANSYTMGIYLVILNKDGSLLTSFKEGATLRGKINTGSLVYDNSNFITAAVETS